MNKKIKLAAIIFMVPIILSALVVGSSFIFSLFIGYSFHPLLIISAYVQKFSVNKANEAVLFTVMILIGLAVGIVAFFQRPPKLYGNAKLGNPQGLRKAKMLKKDPLGIIVGKQSNQLITISGINHLSVISPTGAGKGVSFVIPNLLHFEGSMIVVDVKGENYDITSGWRASIGQEIYILDPAETNTHRFNPFAYIRSDSYLLDDIQRIANILVVDNDPTWRGGAIDLFMGLSLVCIELADLKGWPVSLPQVYKLLKPSDQSLDDFIEDLLNDDYPLSDTARSNLIAFLSKAEKTRASVLFTLQSSLSFMENDLVKHCLSGNDFHLADFRRKPMTLYLVTKPLDMKRLSPVFRLFSEFFLIQNQTLPEKDPQVKLPVALMLDEMARLGRQDELAESITFQRGYGIMILPVLQYPSQLEGIYGKEQATTFMKNFYGELIIPAYEMEEAEAVEKKVGYTTKKQTNYSHSKNGRTKSFSDVKMPLLHTDKILEMGRKGIKAILLHRLIEPTVIKRIIWYEDPFFNKRALAPHPRPRNETETAIESDYSLDGFSEAFEEVMK